MSAATLQTGKHEVEVDLVRRLPGVVIVGLPGAFVREVGDLARQHVELLGGEFPRQRVVVNISPAVHQCSKVAALTFAGPIATAVMVASKQWRIQIHG